MAAVSALVASERWQARSNETPASSAGRVPAPAAARVSSSRSRLKRFLTAMALAAGGRMVAVDIGLTPLSAIGAGGGPNLRQRRSFYLPTLYYQVVQISSG